MFTPFILFLGLTVATAFIAHWSDNLGKKLGKKRVSLFGLRPRTTATILTVASSWAIMGFTILVLLIAVAPLRNALFRYDAERAEYKRDIGIAKQEINATQRQLNAKQGELSNAQSSLSTVSGALERANSNIVKVRTQAKVAEDEAKKRVNLAKTQAGRASAQAKVAQSRASEAQRRENEAQRGEREAEQLKRSAELALSGSRRSLQEIQGRFGQTQARLSQAQSRLADTNSRLKILNTRLGLTNEFLRRARDAAFEAGGKQLVLERDVLALQKQRSGLVQERDELIQLRDSLVQQRDALVQQREALSDEVLRLAAGDVRIPVGRVFVSRTISAGQDPQAIEAILRQIFAQGEKALAESKDIQDLYEQGFRLQLLTLVGDKSGNFDILEPGPFYTRKASEIAAQGQATSIRLVAFRNFTPILKNGERPESNPILVHFVTVPVAIAFRSGETIASAVIDGAKGDAQIFSALLDLTEEGRAVAVQRKVDPPQSPFEPNFYANDDTKVNLFQALRRIEANRRPMRVNLVAAKDLSTVEPLRIRFEIENNEGNS